MKMKTRILTGIAAIVLGVTSAFSVSAVDTELHEAVKEQNFERVKTLCKEHSEWVNEFDDHWSDALSYAVENKDMNAVKCLVENGADVTRGLRCAMHPSGIDDLVKYFVENGADVNIGLWDAVRCLDNIDLVKYFVENGADVNKRWGSWTLLQCSHNIEVMEYLINHGVDINVQDGTGQTALHWVCQGKDIVKLKWLIEHGADVN
ncbi:MAG: ankyrin repeat domain-containing protein, partial [Clostridia bacterium]|nr:ankyrin repeat domain-containing protein [Clostridia bacterium]